MQQKMKDRVKKLFIYLFLIFLAIICILPLWILFVNATRSTPEIQQGISLVPSNNLSENFGYLIGKGVDITRGFLNSITISVPVTILTVYFSFLTAYALKIYNFFYKRFLYNFIIVSTIIPTQTASIIGFYRYISQIGLLNSYIPLILPAIASSGMVFFAAKYLESILVRELIEASRIEGAGELKIFHRVVLPISKPGVATVAILAFVSSWNNFFIPFMIISRIDKYTLPMMVKLLRGDMYRTEYGAIYLGLAITIIPIVVVYALFSKYIISGITLGSVKE